MEDCKTNDEESDNMTLNIYSEPFRRKTTHSEKLQTSRHQWMKGSSKKNSRFHQAGTMSKTHFANMPPKYSRPLKKPISEFDSGLDSLPDDLLLDNEPQDKVKKSESQHMESMQEEVEKRPSWIVSKKKMGSMDKVPLKHVVNTGSNASIKKPQHISSLFYNNPEIPHISTCQEKGKQEELFSKKSFHDLNLHPHLISCLENKFNVTKMTEVQEKAVPMLLDGRDALIKSCTGSGKTLAYAVPIMEKLQNIRPKIQRSDGIHALVILPTRELAIQSYDCFSTLSKTFTWIVPGYLIGGEKKKSEKARIRKGINVLISTPGRLLDHLDHTNNLSLSKIEWLVIDEADKLLEQGFEEAVLKIVSHCTSNATLPQRQTVLLSATLSRSVEKLAGMSMKDPVYIDISAPNEVSAKMEDLVVPSQLNQFAVVTPTKLRLVTLAAFLIDKCAIGKTKALVFVCTQRNVDFYFLLFRGVLKVMLKEKGYNIKFFKLHGSMKQEDRTEVFNKFKNAENGVLLCTDVAARGIDLPHVDWIVQYSVPVSAEDYVHRVGRTARIGRKGQSLLFLIPSEVKFLSLLHKHKLHLNEFNMNDIISSILFLEESVSKKSNQRSFSRNTENYATNLQLKFEEFVYSDQDAHDCAKEAFLSFAQAYASYPKPLRPVVPFKMLHLGHAAKSFCLRESPSELGCHLSKPSSPKKQFSKKPREGKKRSFSEISEYGSGLDQWKTEIPHPRKKFKKKH